jgi:hypothetical protein
MAGNVSSEIATENILYRIYINAGIIGYFAERGSGINIQYTVDRMPPIGVPFHLAMVRPTDTDDVTFYLNGEQIGASSSGLDGPTDGQNARLYIGTSGDAAADFDGVIASVKIINSALTAAQIKAEYNRTLGPALGELS